jgi:ATP-dependent Clp protease ATP-binding subunit ClpA
VRGERHGVDEPQIGGLMEERLARAKNPTDVPLAPDLVRLIAEANEESVRQQHEFIGTQHFVLAVTHRADSPVMLRALALEPDRVTMAIDETVQRARNPVRADIDRPFTSRTKQAFSYAAATAHELGHSQISVPDLLVGIMRERKNIGAQVLAAHGLTEERALQFAREAGAAR